MERRDFLNNVGQTLTFICAGSLIAACSKSGSTPSPVPPQPFTVDLNSALPSIGSSTVHGNVIIIRVADGNVPSSFEALSLTCTHQGCTVNYDQSKQMFACPCHGSTFDGNGNVLQGPATKSLAKYPITINNNILSIG
jgi:cytochrome b6-f complex iron-sulfur subunit